MASTLKWGGQHVYDLISRFNTDVYLDGPTAGGSDPDKFLGLDSNNKIIYRTGAEVLSDIGVAALISAEDLDVTSDSGTIDVDLNSETLTISGGSGIDTSATGTTVTIAGEDASTSNKGVASFNSNHFSTSSGAVSLGTAMTWADTVITTDSLTFTSANADDPAIILQNTTNDAQGTRLQFIKNRGVDGVDSDNVGEIEFWGYDDGTPSIQQYGKIVSKIHDATSGEESGEMKLTVASHDGGNNSGLVLTGGSVNNEVDAKIGNGTASVTTVAGDLTVTGSDLTFDSVSLTAVQTSAESFVDNDTSIMTSAAIQDKILAYGYSTTTGDITGVTLTTDDSEVISDTAGSADFTIAGGEGIDTTSADSTITITGELASSSNKGVASFEADEFTVASGVVNLRNAVSRVYGNTTIKILPYQFMANEEAGVNPSLQFVDNDLSGIKPGANTIELLAFVDIPEGKKATHVDVYMDSNEAFEVFEMDIHETVTDLSAASKGSGNANTQLDITDVNATATNYLMVRITTLNKTDRVFGGLITIADQ